MKVNQNKIPLTDFRLIFPFTPLESIRCFQGVWKENSGLKWVNWILSIGYSLTFSIFQSKKLIEIWINHSVKSVQIWSFSGPYFPVFGLNTEKCGPEKLHIWTLFTQWVIQIPRLLHWNKDGYHSNNSSEKVHITLCTDRYHMNSVSSVTLYSVRGITCFLRNLSCKDLQD